MAAAPSHSSTIDGAFGGFPQEDGLAADAAAYARTFGVSQVEAERRLTRQAEYGEIVAAIEAAAPDRFGGSWINHEGSFGLYVRLTGTSMPPSVAAIVESEGESVTVLLDAAHSLTAAERIIDSTGTLLDEHEPTQGVFYDTRTEEFVLDMVGGPAVAENAAAVEAALRASLPAELPPEILNARIELLGEPIVAARRGGLDLSQHCTSGFSVRNSSGQYGFLTAAHCANTQSYRMFGSSSWHSAPYRGGLYTSSADVQWHQVSASVSEPRFHGSSESTWRPLEGRRLRTQQDGHGVCKRGMTTGYSCGIVTSITFRPTFDGACGGNPCQAVWIRVEGSGLECNRGDSGGPIFSGNIAYGLTSSIGFRSDLSCAFNVHMAPDYIAPLGVWLYYD